MRAGVFRGKPLGSRLVFALALAGVSCSEAGSPPSDAAGGVAGNARGGASGASGAATSGGASLTGGTAGVGGRGGAGTAGSGGTSGGALAGAATSGGFAGNAGGATTGGATSAGATNGGGGVTGGAGLAAGNGAGGTGGASGGGSGGAESGAGGMSAGASGVGGAAGSGGSAGSGVLAATPPMGWNSWNAFACNGLNETVVKSMADAFVTTGMKDVGYEYVNLDDCWMDGRDSSGNLKWNASKFPSGIPALAEYIHEKGLKIGIYSTPNTKTCAALYGGYTAGVGSAGHETQDAQTFASWGIDYLKYDKCQGQLSAFATMRDALRATGRPIFYSINPADQGPYCVPSNCSIDLVEIANMWRIEFDISASWTEVIRLIDKNKPEYAAAGPGHWNDPDMLEVGNGLNDTEGRAHFSMWAIMAAPLITGNDLATMSATTKETLTNPEVIAVDQDPLGKQGRVVATPGSGLEVWSKELVGTNTRAVALFNRNSSGASITVQWSQIGIPAGAATVRDLWSHTDLGSFNGSYTATGVASHNVVMLKIVSTP
jgi:alpha-galactosidase